MNAQGQGYKQKEKARELERLKSTGTWPTSQPCGSTQGPHLQVLGNQFYSEQTLSQGEYSGTYDIPEVAISALAVPAPLDFSTTGGVSLDEESGSADRGIHTSACSKSLLFQSSRSSTQDFPIGDSSSTSFPSFQTSVQTGVELHSSLGMDLFYSKPDSQTAFSPTLFRASQILSFLCTDLERRGMAKAIESEEIDLRDIVRLGLTELGATMDVTQFHSANDKPASVWISEVGNSCEPYDIGLAAWTGIRIILQMKEKLAKSTHTDPSYNNMPQEGPPGLPNLSVNTIMFKCTSWMSASVANAEFLRIPLELLMEDSSESPFTQRINSISSMRTLSDDHPQLTWDQTAEPFRIREITSDMTPTMVQYTKSHHPYLDLIPWPTIRSKAIVATCVTPPLIDEEDLCLDLMNGAFRCWGSMRSQHGRGEGAPWDVRSWEAAPWFINKWSILIHGDGGEIARNSAWWRKQNAMPSVD